MVNSRGVQKPPASIRAQFHFRSFGQLSVVVMRTFDSLETVADEAGAGPELRKYLLARGVKAVPTLALIAKNEDELHRVLLDPIFTGFDDGTLTYKVEAHEQPIAKAIITHMWSLARTSWARALSAATPVASPTPIPSATPGTTAAPVASAEPKVPKTLPPGVWSSLVQQYQQVQLGGQDRTFPVHELIGAECVLARMYHELTITKQFTPVLLGEVLQKRSFNAAGEVNPLQKSPKKATTLTMDEDHQLVQTEDPVWNPRSMLAVLDGITSVKWAMILVRWGEEKDVCVFCDWMTQKARSRPQKSEQFVAFWLSSGWQLAMAMRSGTTFKEATTVIMKDVDRFNEHMAKEIPVDRKKPVNNETGLPGKGRNSKGAKDKGKGHLRWQPYPTRDRWSSNPTWHANQQHHQQQWWNKSNAAHQSQAQDTGAWEKYGK